MARFPATMISRASETPQFEAISRSWTDCRIVARLARFSHGTIKRERDDATLPKIWTPRDEA
jgi:hypothetical protein